MQLRENEALAEKLKRQVNVALGVVEQNYEALVRSAVADALSGDKQMKRFLIEMPFKIIQLTDTQDTPFGELRRKWSTTYSEETVIPVGDATPEAHRGPVIEVTGEVVA